MLNYVSTQPVFLRFICNGHSFLCGYDFLEKNNIRTCIILLFNELFYLSFCSHFQIFFGYMMDVEKENQCDKLFKDNLQFYFFMVVMTFHLNLIVTGICDSNTLREFNCIFSVIRPFHNIELFE